jgi:hypothetical protein
MYTKATVTPIREEHKNGKGYLTDDGWVAWCVFGYPTPGWYTCYDSGGTSLECAETGPFRARPTVVITLS